MRDLLLWSLMATVVVLGLLKLAGFKLDSAPGAAPRAKSEPTILLPPDITVTDKNGRPHTVTFPNVPKIELSLPPVPRGASVVPMPPQRVPEDATPP